jgi:hypothetical protein
MKMMVILAVLLASLLVLTGAAFATIFCLDSCPGYSACYKVTGTDTTNPANSFMQDWHFCYSYDGDSLGYVCEGSGTNFLFGFSFFCQGLNDQAAGIGGGKGAYMTFHGSDDGAFNGLYYNGVDQFNIHGVREACIG